MRKIYSLMLVITIFLSFCACNGNLVKDAETKVEKESVQQESTQPQQVYGTYRTVGIFLEDEYYLNENTTFDTKQGEKGTYTINDNGFTVKPKDSVELTFVKKDNIYYKTGFMDCFEEDKDYGLEPSFDEDGRSNQSFEGNFGDINRTYQFSLKLNEDGTYTTNYWIAHNIGLDIEKEETREGEYRLEDDILWLNYKGTDYPMILADGKIYFDVIEKVE